jgi:Tol biopolymer transport system component
LLVEGVMIIIVLSIILVLSPSLLDQSAFGTFPGENGKIAFMNVRDGNAEVYVMNADGSGQIKLTSSDSVDSMNIYQSIYLTLSGYPR